VYVHRDVPVTHELRVLAVAALLVSEAVVTGCSAAVLWGVDLAGPEDVELTLPPTAHPRRVAGVRVRRAVLPPGEVRRRRGMPATTPKATAVRVAAALPHDEAVVAVDRLVASGRVDLEPIRTLAAAQSGPGAGRAESPQETRLRLLMLRGRLPLPVAQYVVRCDGVFVARVDFAWPDLKVAVEYDGLWHAAEGQFARDRQRLNRLHAAGWRVVFVTAADLHHPEQLIARIAAALAR
jgi:very-short-patch-repair endonuclease